MISDDDGPATKPAAHVVGQDLSALSIADLEARIIALGAEIKRLEAMKASKIASQAAAAAFFKL